MNTKKRLNTDNPVVTIYGDAGSDTFIFGGFSYEVYGRGGSDYIADAPNGADADARDWYHGGTGDDTLISLNGFDHLHGGTGDDEFFFLSRNDNGYVKGGDGRDVLTIWTSDVPAWAEDLGGNQWIVHLGNDKEVTVEDVEQVKFAAAPPEML